MDYEKKTNYNYWGNHIKYVVKNAKELAKKYNADIEIVKLGALLHDIAVPSEYGDNEEQCVADVDVMAHFNCIPDLFSLVYHDKNMNIKDGAEYVKKKLERDFEKLSPQSKEMLKDRYDSIMKIF